MSWNHRVLAHKEGNTVVYAIHEVYYDKDGVPEGHTQNDISVRGSSIEGLSWTLDKMKKCLEKPILSVENFPEKFKPEE